MTVLFNPSGIMAGRFQRFGSSSTGSATKLALIGPTQIAAATSGNNGNYAIVDKLKVSVAKSGSNSVFQLELSADGTTYSEVARIEVPDYGIVGDPDVQIYIPAGYYYKVSVTQSTIARCSASLVGRTAISDLTDV
jgi:hypothetical protein